MVAGCRPFYLNRLVQLSRALIRPGYGDRIDYDPVEVEHVRAVMASNPTVLLPSHKSNLDAAVTKLAIRDNGLPPPHIFAGINMAFWPMGPAARRAGSIFIRRDTKDLPVYRFTLREYIGYLVENRQHLEWYIEGGRSRTGKLLPPRLGLLVYVIDAYLEGRVDDIVLVPMSIVYDQLSDVRDFAHEAGGGEKQPEGVGWLVEFYRRQRRRYGRIYVRFGEPLSLRDRLGPPAGSPAGHQAERGLQKLALEVSWRINQVTPVTANALVALTLLGAHGVAMTLEQLRIALGDALADVRRRRLPLASSVEALDHEEGVRATLDSLEANGTVRSYTGGPDPVYSIGDDQHLAAAFYRNTAIHFFVNPAIAEVAVAGVARSDHADGTAVFWAEAMNLRDLLKFEFFFPDRDEFIAAVGAGLTSRAPRWENELTPGGAGALLTALHPSFAGTVLRSFVEAYSVVAHELVRREPTAVIDHKSFLAACQATGQQYLLQRRLRTNESLSRPLYATGLQLAESRGLLTPGNDVADRRWAFRRELDRVLDLISDVDDLARRRFRAQLAEQRQTGGRPAVQLSGGELTWGKSSSNAPRVMR
jgi:glycerol-3-phosphate O-acyltransferase